MEHNTTVCNYIQCGAALCRILRQTCSSNSLEVTKVKGNPCGHMTYLAHDSICLHLFRIKRTPHACCATCESYHPTSDTRSDSIALIAHERGICVSFIHITTTQFVRKLCAVKEKCRRRKARFRKKKKNSRDKAVCKSTAAIYLHLAGLRIPLDKTVYLKRTLYPISNRNVKENSQLKRTNVN